MFHKMFNAAYGLGRAKLRNTIIAGAAMACIPTAAFARHPNFHLDALIPPPPIFVEPACPVQRQWVDPVYQDVTEQVWVPAVTTTQIQRVEVPAEYVWRDVVSYDFFGRPHRSLQQVQVCAARCKDQPVEVVVTPGHYELQTHQQLVCAGHWQDAATPVTVVRPGPFIGFPLPF